MPPAIAFPEPTTPRPDRAAVLVGYLDFLRATVAAKVAGLPGADAARSGLPSGWTPRELVVHLTAMERRWLVWGFAGSAVDDPWSDERDGRWHADPTVPTGDLLAALAAQGRETAAIVAAHALDAVGAPGPRWAGEPPATLERVLLHVLQEYARHLGQLDVVVELATGATGE